VSTAKHRAFSDAVVVNTSQVPPVVDPAAIEVHICPTGRASSVAGGPLENSVRNGTNRAPVSEHPEVIAVNPTAMSIDSRRRLTCAACLM
jgi:hypothetical protein